jgi:DNA-binding MarR family transcriptional regulator
MSSTPTPPLPALPCLCANLRRASRALTQLYEDALRPLGLRSSQFTILQALSLTGEASQGRIGEILSMDSTTLTRTLAIMLRHKWLAERRGHDRRERLLRLTPAGKAHFRRALPIWEKVQSHVRMKWGEQPWNNFFQLTQQLSELVTTPGVSS